METPQNSIKTAVTRESENRLGLLLVSLVAIAAFADFCFWRDNPRLSVGLFVLGLAALVLLNREGDSRWSHRAIILTALICGGAVEAAFDFCFSNIVVLLALLFALAGETYYPSLRSGWSRWSEALWSFVKTPGRWIWLTLAVAGKTSQAGNIPETSIKKLARGIWIVVPGLFATLVFGLILANGNALIADLTNHWFSALQDWFLHLDIGPGRIFFWVFITWISLPFLRPSPSRGVRIWAKDIPRPDDSSASSTAGIQSLVTLCLLNGLFCFVNTIDAIYLWAHQTLPAGVDYKVFVHEGVTSLIVAVIFSALLLTGIFQQPRSISGSPRMRLLGSVWIVQNLILLAGVCLRLKLYIDATFLSVTRVNLIFFLLLVTIGFGFLTLYVLTGRTLGWLLHSNMLATFFLFYVIQFIDTSAFVSWFNVDLWLKSNQTRALYVEYEEGLGTSAYGALLTVAHSGNSADAKQAGQYLASVRAQARSSLDNTPWASWQLRDMKWQRKLLTEMPDESTR